MKVDEAFQSRVVELVMTGPNRLGPEGLEVLSAEAGRTKVTWAPGNSREVPAIRLHYRWHGDEGDFEFPLDPELWGGSTGPDDAVNYLWTDLDETLTAID